MTRLKIIGGVDKNKNKERISSIEIISGSILSIVGKTGSGKTQLIEDIECLSSGDGLTRRYIELEGIKKEVTTPIAHLSQNMQFVLDLTVGEFLTKRLKMLKQEALHSESDVLECANALCGEAIEKEHILTQLSGGQSRALMIADVAMNSQAEVILVDEIENAGIDKLKAMELLVDNNKIVILITHDPLLALYGERRLVMENGGIKTIVERSEAEKNVLDKLYKQNRILESLRKLVREGESIEEGAVNTYEDILE